MKIYIDDIRSAPDGYKVARNFDQFRQLLKLAEENGEKIEEISFDNDLGEDEIEGYEIMKWVAQNKPQLLVGETEINIHSANPRAPGFEPVSI